jgi:hypothetical protein
MHRSKVCILSRRGGGNRLGGARDQFVTQLGILLSKREVPSDALIETRRRILLRAFETKTKNFRGPIQSSKQKSLPHCGQPPCDLAGNLDKVLIR